MGRCFYKFRNFIFFFNFLFIILSYSHGHLLVCKSKNFASWVYRLMIRFIVLSSFFLQDYISFILSLVFFLSLFFWGSSFPSKVLLYLNLRSSEVHLFYNLG